MFYVPISICMIAQNEINYYYYSCSNWASTTTPSEMKTIFLVCVLGLLAASLAEDAAQTEPVDDGAVLDRGVRKVTEELGDVDTDANVKIVNRQKRRC